ncbi:hypothetical protein C8Q73DRAFT_718812 [Cubamyces lactineus]|nr:hypothetical protein C8Q73DRAFT_718812 [Cubamyces lactineus]
MPPSALATTRRRGVRLICGTAGREDIPCPSCRQVYCCTRPHLGQDTARHATEPPSSGRPSPSLRVQQVDHHGWDEDAGLAPMMIAELPPLVQDQPERERPASREVDVLALQDENALLRALVAMMGPYCVWRLLVLPTFALSMQTVVRLGRWGGGKCGFPSVSHTILYTCCLVESRRAPMFDSIPVCLLGLRYVRVDPAIIDFEY